MATLLLTGGTGFLGSYIRRELEKTGHADVGYDEVRLLVRDPTLVPSLRDTRLDYEVVKGDLLEPESLREVTEGVDAVIHVASLYNNWSERSDFMAVNVDGTRNLMENLEPETKFVLTSTTGVYGFPNVDEPIREDFEPKDPYWHYQESKKEQEDLAFRLAEERGIEIVAVRPSSVTGPEERFAVPTTIQNIREESMVLVGGGENTIPFAHPVDVARAHLLALKNASEVSGEAFHLASFHTTFKEYIGTFCEELGVEPVTRSVPYFLAYVAARLSEAGLIDSDFTRFTIKFTSSHTILDTSKIEEELGWESGYDLEETIRETVEWYESEKPSMKEE